MPEPVLYCGDCLTLMRGMPTGCVDLVMCSPPYEAARTYGIDFKLRGQSWVDWAVERFVECVRVCKGMVCWVVEGQTREFRWSAVPALMMADLHRAGVHLRKPPAFCRNGIPGSGGPDWFRNDYEFIVCGSKGGKLPWSDNTAMGHPPKWGPGGEMSYRQTDGTRRNQWGGSASRNGSSNERKPDGSRRGKVRPSHVVKSLKKWGEGGFMPETKNGDAVRRRKVMTRPRDGMNNQEQDYAPPVLSNPGNLIRCLVGGGVMGSRLCHENEAPFPERLAEFLVRSCCPPDGIVLDPFSGSGTTGAVAVRAGRRYVGFDIRESQVELTRRRMKEVQLELKGV